MATKTEIKIIATKRQIVSYAAVTLIGHFYANKERYPKAAFKELRKQLLKEFNENTLAEAPKILSAMIRFNKN